MNGPADRARSLRWAAEYGRNAAALWRKGDHEAAARVWRLAWGRALHGFGRPDHGSDEGWMQLFAAVVREAINDGSRTVEQTTGIMRRFRLGHHVGCKPGQVITPEMAQGFIESARRWVRSIYGHKPVLMRAIDAFWNNPRCACGRRVLWPAPRCEVCQRKEDKRRERQEREREKFLVWCALETEANDV